MATKRQSAEYREKEAVAKVTKRQSAEYRERERSSGYGYQALVC